MGSSRLPGKVLLDIAGEPMLARVIERASMAETVDQVIVATTNLPEEDPIADFCAMRGYPCFRGNLHDVLDRYYQAAVLFNAGIIVRITADCPLIDPGVVDNTVNAFLETGHRQQRLGFSQQAPALTKSDQTKPDSKPGEDGASYDFAANRLPPPWGRTYPIGLDTEVCTFHALQIAWQEANEPHQREHVMPFFYDHQDRFRILLVNHEVDYGALRWTVDTPEDLELVRQIFAHFHSRDDFSWLEIVELFERHPELAQVNARVRHKVYNEIDDRAK